MYSSNNDSADHKYELLREAIKRKNTVAANLLLEDSPVNPSKRHCSNTPLHWAIKSINDTEFIAMLLDKGADIYAKNHRSQTPLETALEYSRDDIMQLLLRKSKKIDEDLQLLIIQATTNDNKIMLKFLIDYAVDARITVSLRCAVDIAAKAGYVSTLTHLLLYYKPHVLSLQHIPIEVMKNGKKSLEIFNLLTQYGFTVSDEDKNNFEFLYSAVEVKCISVVKEILRGDIDVNQINEATGCTLLHVACINKDGDMVKLLIKYNADLNIKVTNALIWRSTEEHKFINKTPLFIAVYKSDAKVTKLLLKNGANMAEESYILITALQQSSKQDCLKVVEHLLKYGANVNATDELGATPLFHSIAKNVNFYKLLTPDLMCPPFKVNADVDIKEIVELLLKKGANPNIGYTKASPLQSAIAEGYINVVKLLLQYTDDINHKNVHGNTPLHFAANANLELLEVILAQHPDFDIVNNQLTTPLHIAATRTNANIMRKLLAKSIKNVNSPDKNGNTPLHIVCRSSRSVGIINYLFKHNANASAINKNGETPFHVFVACSSLSSAIYKNVITSFAKYNANFNIVDKNGRTPLIAVCQESNDYFAKLLVKNGADINWKCPDGTTLIHYAAQYHNLRIFQFSLIHGADINIVSNNQQTALNHIKHAINRVDLNQDPHTRPFGLYEGIKARVEQRMNIYILAREHVVKLRCAKLPVNKINFDFVYEDCELRERADAIVSQYGFKTIKNISNINHQCKEEIEKLKDDKIGYSSLYDILTQDIHDVANFAKNEQLTQNLESIYFKEQFPLYSDIIKNRFAEAVKRNELLDIAKTYFHSTIFIGLPISCVSHILRYLNRQNLITLIKTIQ